MWRFRSCNEPSARAGRCGEMTFLRGRQFAYERCGNAIRILCGVVFDADWKPVCGDARGTAKGAGAMQRCVYFLSHVSDAGGTPLSDGELLERLCTVVNGRCKPK